MIRFILLFLLLFGVFVAATSLALVVAASPLAGQQVDLTQVFVWSSVFLLGIFIAGWSLGRLVSIR